jgi:hypothetical protein
MPLRKNRVQQRVIDDRYQINICTKMYTYYLVSSLRRRSGSGSHVGLERKCGSDPMALGLKHKTWGPGGNEAYAEMDVVDQSSKVWGPAADRAMVKPRLTFLWRYHDWRDMKET